MASFTDVASTALMGVAKIARKLQGLCRVVLQRCRVADEENTEQGLNLGNMERSGFRNRRAPEQTTERADDHVDSPTTSATSGTLTPRTNEGPLETQGMDLYLGYLSLSQLTQVILTQRFFHKSSLATSF
jgi:hypothetical protein